jgi:hypothetical protein
MDKVHVAMMQIGQPYQFVFTTMVKVVLAAFIIRLIGGIIIDLL